MARRHLAATFALTGVALGALTALSASTPVSASPPSTASGVLEVLHEDHMDEGRSVHQYRLVGADGSRTELLFDDRGPEGLGARSVRVTGTQVRPGVMRVGTSAAVQEAGDGTGGTTVAETTTAVTQKKVAVILFDFADSGALTERPLDRSAVRDAVFGVAGQRSVQAFMAETSFSQLSLTGVNNVEGDVFDWVRIAASKESSCDFNGWGSAARSAAAAAQGFQDGSYDQVIHLMPTSDCKFGGVAYMPGKYSWTVLYGVGADLVPALRRVTSHEYGHNLGIHHAGSYRCTESGRVVPLSTNARNCTLEEYGDPFSVLGMSPAERQYHGYQKGRVGWIAGATQDVTASGTFSLSAVNVAGPTSPKVLRIARPSSKGSSDFLYLELRQPSGFFDAFDDGDFVHKGVTIRVAPDYGVNAVSKLIDTSPGSIDTAADRAAGYGGDFEDAALALGSTFKDPASNITVTTDSVGDGVATVTVTFPATQTKGGGGGRKASTR